MRTVTLTALIGLGLALSACGGTENRGLESVHQPVVKRSDFVLDVDASSDGLSSAEVRRLSGWLEALRVGYGDRIAIDTAYGPASSGTRDIVASIAAKHGLLLDDTAPVTEGEVPAGIARIVVSRVTASVPGCPDWSRTSIIDANNHSKSNFGCAVNSNLASMVANPQDLVLGAANSDPNDPMTSSRAVKNYREGKSNTVKAESSRSN